MCEIAKPQLSQVVVASDSMIMSIDGKQVGEFFTIIDGPPNPTWYLRNLVTLGWEFVTMVGLETEDQNPTLLFRHS